MDRWREREGEGESVKVKWIHLNAWLLAVGDSGWVVVVVVVVAAGELEGHQVN